MIVPPAPSRTYRQMSGSVPYSAAQTPSRVGVPAAVARTVPQAAAPADFPNAAEARRAILAAADRLHLTERELQVLVGMSRGLSNSEIGRELYLAQTTVKTHVKRLLRKLQARNRAHAVHRGWELQILSGWELGILPSGGAR